MKQQIKMIALLVFAFLGTSNLCYSQGKVTSFKSLIQNVESGSGVEVVITPLTFDAYKEDYKSRQYKYGVRICYTVGSEKKAARQDMSYDIHKNGKYTFRLAYSSKYTTYNVQITDIEYFNMEDDPKSQWPTKEDCD